MDDNKKNLKDSIEEIEEEVEEITEEIKEDVKEIIDSDDEPKKPRKKKPKTKLIIGIIIAVIILGGVLAIFLWGKSCGTTEVSLTGIGGSFRDLGELNLQSYDYTGVIKIQDSDQIGSWNVPLTEKILIYSIDGCVKASVDMTQVSDDDIAIEKNDDGSVKTLTVTLPGVEITDSYIDTSSRHTIYDLKNLFNQLDSDELTSYESALKAAYYNRAIDNGIIEKAEDNAKELLTTIIKANPDYKGSNVVINIKESNVEYVDVDEAFNESIY